MAGQKALCDEEGYHIHIYPVFLQNLCKTFDCSVPSRGQGMIEIDELSISTVRRACFSRKAANHLTVLIIVEMKAVFRDVRSASLRSYLNSF
jgi:hypothetical protein